MDIVSLWDKTLQLIKGELSPPSFNAFFKQIIPLKIHMNELILLVPNDFTKGILEDRYLNLIESSINQLSLKKYKVKFVLDEKYVEGLEEEPKSSNIPQKNYPNLNPKYTFDTFVIGNSNRFAHAACVAVAESPAKAYNPLFLYGGVGLGKTHILHAIGNYITENKPELNVVYVTTEQFTNEFIETVGKNELNLNSGFRNKYRNADVLIVDDVQSIIGKPRVQEEFFHTFNALTSQNKQIVLSSDRPPKEINPLEERLRSRFEWGLITDIGVPEIETRIAILKKKCIIDRQVVDDEVLQYISEAMTSNVRELEGFLSRCVFYAGLLKKPKVTIDVAKEALKNYITVTKVTYDSDKILEKVCSYFEISKNQLLGKDRRKELSYARQIAMYLLDELMNMPYTSIGKIFGKDHATVIYCKNKVASELKTNKLLETQVKDIKGLCGAKLD